MVDNTSVQEGQGLRWFQGISRYAWMVLVISALGWMFDTFDQQLFTLIRQKSLVDILEQAGYTGKALDDAVKATGGWLTAIFMIGWAIGGFLFGILGDRLGRARTMMITILIYALFTGLNALVHTPWQYAICRFFTALGIGGEFAVGASLVAEIWPNRSRPMALGTLQALSAVGNILAALTTAAMAALNWRWVYVVGALPAILVVFIRIFIKEPEQWRKIKETAEKEHKEAELGRITEIFTHPVYGRHTLAGILIALAGVGGLWGIVYFLPELIGKVMGSQFANLSEDQVKTMLQKARSNTFLVLQIGAFLGMLSYAAISERMGRRPALAAFFVLLIAVIQAAFWGIRDMNSAYILAFFLGFFALAPFSAFAVYFPELYPTRLRSTGVGVCYNCARILGAVVPIVLGWLATRFVSPTDEAFGYRVAASIASSVYLIGFIGLIIGPETKGKPLPE